MPVMGNSYAEEDGKPQRVVPGRDQPRPGRRRGAQGRHPLAGGAGDRRTPSELGFADFVARYDELVVGRARQHAAARRLPGREHHADQPRRHRHRRLRAAADAGPGHDRRHRRDRLPARPRPASTPSALDELGVAEGHDDDLDLRPPRDPGRRVGRLPAARRRAAPGRGRLLRRACFEALGLDAGRPRRRRPPTPRSPPPSRCPAAATPGRRRCADEALLQAVQAATSVVKAHRMHGHLAARLDPLGSEPLGDPALDPATVDLTAGADGAHPGVGAARGRARRDLRRRAAAPARDLLRHDRLRDRAHLRPRAARLAAPGDRVGRPTASRSTPRSSARCSSGCPRSRRSRATCTRPSWARSSSRSRASTRSCRCSTRRSSWPPRRGAREVVLGMAHRGRLNVLAHTVGRPYESILVEFEGEQTLSRRHRRARGRHRRREVPLRRLRHLQDAGRQGRDGHAVAQPEPPRVRRTR